VLAVAVAAVLGGRDADPSLQSLNPVDRLNGVAVAQQEQSSAICHPVIPEDDCKAAVFVYEFVLTHNWSPPKGYAGGKKFANKDGVLPANGDYKEYDIYPKPPPGPGGGRDAKRIVIDVNTQIMFYTADHFATFVKLTYS
jgi:hypothetical protein